MPTEQRCLSSFVQSATHEIMSKHASETVEIPIYNEQQVQKWLSEFKGGSVILQTNDKTGLATITLSNPGKKNAFTGDMMRQLRECVNKLDVWEHGKALIIRGANGDFCTGGDLHFVNKIADPKLGCRMSIFMQEVTSKINRLPLLTVALVQGHALGGGAELAVACDLRVFGGQEGEAKIGFVQSRLGVSTGWGGGTHLNALVGPRIAFRLLVGGRVLGGLEAEALGLVDKRIPESDPELLEKKTLEWLEDEYLKGYGASLQAIKRMVFNVNECGYAEALNRERDIFTRLWGSRSHRHALQQVQQRLNVKP